MPLPLFVASILAESPVALDWQAGLISFLAVVLIVLNIWDKLKPKETTPPNHKVYATKEELEDVENRLTKNLDSSTTERNVKFAELGTQMDGLQKSQQNSFQEIFYKLGGLESQAIVTRARKPRV